MIRIVLFYLAIQLNGLLVSLYLHDYMTIKVLILLQTLLLGVACLEDYSSQNCSSKKYYLTKSPKMVASWLCVYGCFCSLN